MGKALLTIYGIFLGGLALLGLCVMLAWRLADPNGKFYRQRFYPIPTQATLPASGEQLILSGRHHTKRDRRNPVYSQGSRPLEGLFFVDLTAAELTYWPEPQPPRSLQPEANYPTFILEELVSKPLQILPEGTFATQDLSPSLTERLADYRYALSSRALSVDTQVIAHTGGEGKAPIFIQPLDQPEATTVLSDFPHRIQALLWLPDGQHLILVSCEAGEQTHFYQLNRQTEALTRLYQDPTRRACDGSRSPMVMNLTQLPDGQLMYVYGAPKTYIGAEFIPQELVVLNLQTGQRRLIDTIVATAPQLTILRDQQGVAYLSQGQLYRRSLDNLQAEPMILSHPDGEITEFIEAPDGQHFAYKVALADESIYVNPSDNWTPGMGGHVKYDTLQLWVVGADGGDRRQLIARHVGPRLVGWYHP